MRKPEGHGAHALPPPRQIPVGEIDPGYVRAQFDNGVLKISLLAPAKPEPVKIAISSDSASKAPKPGSRKQLTAKSA